MSQPEPDSAILFAARLLYLTSLAVWSYILNRPVRGHRLQIGHFSWSSAYAVRYEAVLYDKSYSFTFTSSAVSWRFHIPRADNPRWLTVTLYDVIYTSSTGDVSTTSLESVFWFFPVFFRFTAGPWMNVTIDGLRIRVQKSTATPYWIQRLRENLVGTFLTGEFLRADVFRTSVRFAGLSEHQEDKPKGYTDPRSKLSPEVPDGAVAESETGPQSSDDNEPCGCCAPNGKLGSNGHATYAHQEEADALACADEYKTQPLRPYDDDELRFSVLARTVHINNTEGRIYTFGRIDAQMRRNWVEDRGSFAMVAEECRWVRVHFPFERVAPRAWYTQLLSSILHFPIDLVRTFNYPVTSMNLCVTRVDVTFDSFRLRDAELFRQGVALVREKAITSNIDWSDLFFDALLDAFGTRPAHPMQVDRCRKQKAES
ncbi:hypothetical protein BN946_scf184753.g51 [Trametes cinnabarina]|uniref:Uncharacterized protein n=1 Tax=Pycnoporus cinnabarinus TaxID=5643 RepID=A0A060ST57_PYCCI|nr:hypothetical protein BN946_scf184753.g51 [Trametes cinnabarina]